ncbi:MAG: ABC transporter ATP-binding protein, partial [Oscillospiraceae bacterium]
TLFRGNDLRRMPPAERSKQIAIVHQNQDCNFPFTCFEMVLMGLSPHRARFERLKEAELLEAEAVMALTDTLPFAEKQITQISGGELQRVLLARAIAQKPSLLLLDEAMSDLDISAKISMTKLLKRLVSDRNMTVIGIHHDLNTAYRFSDHMVALQHGKVVADGTPQEVMTASFLQQVFGVKGEIFGDKGFFIHDIIEKEKE